MRFQSQTAQFERPQPIWLRFAALLCVLLLASISTAQAAHIHGQWLPHNTPEITKHLAASNATSEDACPLCMAMHSAMPAHRVEVRAIALLISSQAPAVAVGPVVSLWHFELFGRPPPVLL